MTFIIILHAIVCVMLAVIILMQAGRKGGLTEAFAGAESMLGTKTNSFMVRATTIFCILFFVTSLTLAVSSAQKGKSLMTNVKVKPSVPAAGSLDKDVEAAKKQAAAAQVNPATSEAKAVETAAGQAVEAAKQTVTTTADQVVEKVDQAVTATTQAVVDGADKAANQVQATAQDAQQAVEKAVEPVVPAQ